MPFLDTMDSRMAVNIHGHVRKQFGRQYLQGEKVALCA